ncbi:MAG TPA: SDR family oxidoreductase [Terriglobia bacterium]|nr:SDR family oxidoreductase [Terriglobia bacterium]
MNFIPDRFRGQCVLVVGGAQGIGKGIAVRLAREGASVMIGDIDRDMMARTEREISEAGGSIRTVSCDVRRKRDVQRMVAQTLSWQGRLDVLMYVAGVGKLVPFTKTDEKHWDWIVDINLKGAYLVAREVAPHMVRQRKGKMVFMASTNSWDAEAELAPYNASKAGLFLLAKTLARELGHCGINSNAIGPGLIRTRLTAPILKDKKFMSKYKDLIPVGRLGEPEDIAGPAAFLASSDADYINGVLLFVDGGQLA